MTTCTNNMAQLTEQEVTAYKDAFDLLDRNRDGFLNFTEIKNIVAGTNHNGCPNEKVDKILKAVDTDGDGKINFPEFINMMTNFPTDEPADDLQHMFNLFDHNKDGSITVEEMKRAYEIMGEKPASGEIEEMILKADTNGDGTLSYAEFEKIMKETHGPM